MSSRFDQANNKKSVIDTLRDVLLCREVVMGEGIVGILNERIRE